MGIASHALFRRSRVLRKAKVRNLAECVPRWIRRHPRVFPRVGREWLTACHWLRCEAPPHGRVTGLHRTVARLCESVTYPLPRIGDVPRVHTFCTPRECERVLLAP